MAYVADYDPAAFDPDDTATWPQPAPYSPGDWWYVTGPGTVGGVAVDLGDRVYPIGTGRLYGELDYGVAVYGGPPPAPPWMPDPSRVRWIGRAWASAPGWDRPPGPYDGAPFGDTGWRIAVEAFAPDPDARLYGDGTYGDLTYGGLGTDWLDLSCDQFGIVVRRGQTEPAPTVDVDQAQLDMIDLDASAFPITVRRGSALVRGPGVYDPIRVALVDPEGEPWPLFTGRLETAEDDHDRVPRLVALEAFGMVADLVNAADVSREAETAADRLAALLDLAGYTWGSEAAPTPSPTLRRIDPAEGVEVREQVDRAAVSAGLQLTTDALGVIRWEPWPTYPDDTAEPIAVVDRLGADALPIVSARVVADRAELLNLARVTSEAVQGSAELVATAADLPSVAAFGPSTETLGFPLEGLSAQQAELDALAAAVVARHGATVNRVSQLEVDTAQDPRWLRTLATLGARRRVTVTLTKPITRRYDAVVIGRELRITPGRITATLYVSTLDPTL